MAEKRMFTKKITDSDSFIELPSSAQALYFHLNQGADDDGFNNQVQIALFRAHATIDDLKLLIIKKFVIRFESGVIVIKHWYMHNYIRKDTYTETAYKEEKNLLKLDENKAYTLTENQLSLLPVDDSSTQIRVDKTRLDKISIDNTVVVTNSESQVLKAAEEELINVTPMMVEMLLNYEKQYGEDICILAIKECSKHNVRTMAYLESILREWKNKSLEEIKDSIKKHSNNNSKNNEKGKRVSPIPDWIDKKIEKEEDVFEITDEERERFGII